VPHLWLNLFFFATGPAPPPPTRSPANAALSGWPLPR